MSFVINYDKQPKRFLKKQDNQVIERLINKIDQTLMNNPIPHDSKRVIEYNLPTFRIRIGKYRVLYRVNFEEETIIVVKIDKKG